VTYQHNQIPPKVRQSHFNGVTPETEETPDD
jgi:hypothetical protein